MEPTKAVYARTTEARTLYEAIDGADVFLGLSAAGALEPEMLARMAKTPANAARARAAKGPVERVRRLCLALPETSERPSHGEPTFFAGKRVFAMMSLNHHDDGHVAVILPTEPFLQQRLIEERPRTFYFPAYVGVRGWVGVELARIGDRELAELILAAWERVASKRALKARATTGRES